MEIELPNSVRILGDRAFQDNKLKYSNLEKHDKMEYIGEGCFSGNELETLKLPSSLELIGFNITNNDAINSEVKNQFQEKYLETIAEYYDNDARREFVEKYPEINR